MENEKHFYPETKETKPISYEVHFDGKHFGDVQKPLGTCGLVGELNDWWQKICTEGGINPEDERFKNVDYYLVELGKNALEYADGGEIKVIFEPDIITVVITDQGQGFEDQNDVEYSTSSQMGPGLSQVRKFADEFVVETGGKKYAKAKGKRKLVLMGVSDITVGSKINFIKILNNTSPNSVYEVQEKVPK
jgi:hypothetical protein